ncbi:hypothetical protein M569_07179 [Genlisea aurea]|uniref:PX domain-containing protein n=1 Tax=Genlisea aurea TaxID=192259 RepID=S8CLH6_9LAMI|nr:hypothetical protein M569_07179 [Genlisea aurea]
MKAMESLQDLIEEAKLRTVWWILCIFSVCYFLTHTSKSMLMNLPIAVLFVSALRIVMNEVDFHWKVRVQQKKSYLSHLEKKQLSVNDYRLTTLRPPQKWRKKIDSPLVEAAIEDLINKILHDFVIHLWYSEITPDKEAPELMHSIVMDAIGEICGRVKDINLVDLLTRDVVDLIGDHLELFRRNQSAIGADVMATLSSEERDERLKHHLLISKELHPALISAECEYKVLQRLVGGILAVVLRPRDSQCPLVRCISRELLTCVVIRPLLNFASPLYINELIEYIIAYNSDGFQDVATDHSSHMETHNSDKTVSGEQGIHNHVSNVFSSMEDGNIQAPHADWAKAFEAATQRRTEVLMPENLENMWTIGRNYKKKLQKSGVGQKTPSKKHPPRPQLDSISTDLLVGSLHQSDNVDEVVLEKGNFTGYELENTGVVALEKRNKLKRSSSTSDLNVISNIEDELNGKGHVPIISEYYSADVPKINVISQPSRSDVVLNHERWNAQKLKSRVVGAYFEKIGSNSFAVYSIAVTDADSNTWFVKRRYRNFERLHRHLRNIPNYTLQLPPKRIFSSSTEDAFVHQRCIQLDKYLQDLLSIANVSEQHEVWDFLSAASKNYSFGKSASVMKTLAVNVDDAVDDILRQFKGVSDSLMWKVSGSPSVSEQDASFSHRNVSWDADDPSQSGSASKQIRSDSINILPYDDGGGKDANNGENKLVPMVVESTSNYKSISKAASENSVRGNFETGHLDHDEISKLRLGLESGSVSSRAEATLALSSVPQDDPITIPPEWSPPNLSLPVLNLVDNVFQLNRRGWLR